MNEFLIVDYLQLDVSLFGDADLTTDIGVVAMTQ